MLDLIPSLLSQLTTQKVALDDVQPTGTELVFQQEAATPAPIVPIAPPESSPLVSPERLPPVPIQATVAATPAPPIQTSNFAASSTIQRPEAASQSTTPSKTVTVIAQPTPEQRSVEPGFEIVVNREAPAPEKPVAQVSGAAIANPLSTNAALPIVKNSIQNPATASLPTDSSIKPKPPLQNSDSNQSDQLLERRQFLKQRLAEIVAKDTAKKVAQESLVTRAYESVSQGKFTQARQLLQDPTLSTTARADLGNAISSLEAESRKVGVAQATEPVRVMLNQRRLSQRQQDLLRSVPSLPPLKPETSQASVDRGPKSVPIAIQRLPQPLINRQIVAANSVSNSDSSGLRAANQDYSTTNPADPLQAYRGTVPIPNNLKGEQIVYPLPVPAPITSKFGWRVHPVKGDRRFHAGVDLGAAQGTPILATREGRVAIADRLGGYGIAVVLQHAQGKQDTLYAHMSQMLVRPGEQVKPGTIIGRVGSTGLSTGPHLHYETRQQKGSSWVTTDPGPQLEAARSQLVQAQKVSARVAKQQKG